MKVEVIRPFFDDNGIHKIGEIMDVEQLDEKLMKPIKEKAEKPVTKKKD